MGSSLTPRDTRAQSGPTNLPCYFVSFVVHELMKQSPSDRSFPLECRFIVFRPGIRMKTRIRMKKRYAFSVLSVLLLLMPGVSAGTVAPDSQLKLIPAPKEVRVQEGGFHVRPTTRILVEFGHQAEDRIAAETLAEEIHDQSGLKLDITGAKAESKQESKEDSAIVLARLQD